MGLTGIKDRVAKACETHGRHVDDVELVAVSKVQPLERVVSVLDAGHRVFGENRVQEAAGKWPELKNRYDGVKLHLIGPLQTNKARQALELFDVIETVDRPKLAKTLARLMTETGHCPPVYVQINTGETAKDRRIAE